MRIISIVLTELVNDKLKKEEQLQRLINSTEDVDMCVIRIKDALREISLLESMITKWRVYTTPEDNDGTTVPGT